MEVSKEFTEMLEGEVTKKTLSLDALKALSDIKEKLVELEAEHKKLKKEYDTSINENSNQYKQITELKDKLEASEAKVKSVEEENKKLNAIDLKRSFAERRGNELKEITMAVLRNPIRNKEINENGDITNVTETVE